MNRCIFKMISDFAKEHDVDITFEFDCTGDLIITMTRDEYSIDKKIGCYESKWFEDYYNASFALLYSMLNYIICKEINKNYNKPI